MKFVFPNVICSFSLEDRVLTDGEIVDVVDDYLNAFPYRADDWGEWQYLAPAELAPKHTRLVDWPSDFAVKLRAVELDALYDDYGVRRYGSGSDITLQRACSVEEFNALYRWESEIAVGYPAGKRSSATLRAPSHDQPYGISNETAVEYFHWLIRYWRPRRAYIRHLEFALNVRDVLMRNRSGGGTIVMSWKTYLSEQDMQHYNIDPDKLPARIGQERFFEGVIFTVPGTFESPDFELSLELAKQFRW